MPMDYGYRVSVWSRDLPPPERCGAGRGRGGVSGLGCIPNHIIINFSPELVTFMPLYTHKHTFSRIYPSQTTWKEWNHIIINFFPASVTFMSLYTHTHSFSVRKVLHRQLKKKVWNYNITESIGQRHLAYYCCARETTTARREMQRGPKTEAQ